ncbi:TOX high mobility group box family member 3 [Camelus ferus]|nr:TOX high mobility group box family member 3 [Camelus ferus]
MDTQLAFLQHISITVHFGLRKPISGAVELEKKTMVSKPFSISRMPHLLRRWKTSGLRAKVSILTPSQKQEFMVVALEPFGNNNNYMNMAEANNAFFAASEQTFHTPSLGDEEFEIPPITPPPESDPALGMPDVLLPLQGLSDPLPSQGSEFTPQFPPQSLDLPSITISRNLVEQDGVLHGTGLHMVQTYLLVDEGTVLSSAVYMQVLDQSPVLDQRMLVMVKTYFYYKLPIEKDQSHTQVSQYRQDPSLIMRSIVHMTDAARSGIMPPAQLTTINQSQLSAQLGLNLGGASMPHTSPSPPASKSATPSPSSSINEEDADESNRAIGEKRAAPDSGKKPKTPKKKKKKDPNEPQKPVSAYALFFRDTQAAIKGQNPNATFGEVSKIVASMWDSLGEEQKQVYKRKTEAAKKEYLKALAAYRASLVSKAAAESAEAQTIRSVQQTLASTNLTPSLLLSPPLSQHGTVSAPPQTLQQSLPRSIAPKPLTMRLPMNQIVTSVTIAANMPSNIGAPLISSMVGSASSAQLQQLQHMQHQSQPSPRQPSPVTSQMTSPGPAIGSPQPASQQHQSQIQSQTQTQVLSQKRKGGKYGVRTLLHYARVCSSSLSEILNRLPVSYTWQMAMNVPDSMRAAACAMNSEIKVLLQKRI